MLYLTCRALEHGSPRCLHTGFPHLSQDRPPWKQSLTEGSLTVCLCVCAHVCVHAHNGHGKLIPLLSGSESADFLTAVCMCAFVCVCGYGCVCDREGESVSGTWTYLDTILICMSCLFSFSLSFLLYFRLCPRLSRLSDLAMYDRYGWLWVDQSRSLRWMVCVKPLIQLRVETFKGTLIWKKWGYPPGCSFILVCEPVCVCVCVLGVLRVLLTLVHVKLSNKAEIGSRMNSSHAGHHDHNLVCLRARSLHVKD